VAVVVGLCLASAGPARAGVYDTREPSEGLLSPDFRQFRDTLTTLQNLGNLLALRDSGKLTEPNALAKRYLLVADLTKKGSPGPLSTTAYMDLGAALLRLRKYEEAVKVYEEGVKVLEAGKALDRKDFLLLSNLSTAEHLAGRDQRALDHMVEVFDLWPARWEDLGKDQQLKLTLLLGWNESHYKWYRRAETYYRKLLRLRLREALAGQGGKAPEEGLDNLFDDGGSPPRPVRFVGESGQYEAGKLAAAEQAKLPKDAVLLMEQLLVWMPDDVRLYWLLGELYNARGDTAFALEIFSEIVNKGGRFPELREHRRVLQSQVRQQGTTAAGSQGGSAAPAGPDTTEQPWAPSPWETLVLGFLLGLVVAFLGYWQVKEILRRRRQRAAVSRP
jgi:tetratricopeptide (TPR) repeat protein